MIGRIALLAALFLVPFATCLPAQEARDFVSYAEGDYFPLAWHQQFGPPLADCRSFTVYQLSLFATRQNSDGLAFYRFPLGKDRASAEPERMQAPPLPESFLLQEIAVNPFTEHFLAAGKRGGALVVYRTSVSAKGELGKEWQELKIPSPYAEQDFIQILNSGVYSLFLAERYTKGYSETVGWAANLVASPQDVDWIEIPQPPDAREGESYLMASDYLLQVGGTHGETTGEKEGKPASYPIGVKFQKPNFQDWDPMGMPVSRRMTETVGASHGMALFLAPEAPLSGADGDQPTSHSLQFATDKTGGYFSEWIWMDLALPPSEVRTMLIDPANSHLLVMAESPEEDLLDVYAHVLPQVFAGQPVSREDVELNNLRKMAVDLPKRSTEELLASARDRHVPALVIIGSGSRKTDLKMRAQAATSGFRYMIMGTEIGFYEPDDAGGLITDFEVEATPAYLLIDPETNEVLRRHEGSMPSASQVFDLTAPSRVRTPPPSPDQE